MNNLIRFTGAFLMSLVLAASASPAPRTTYSAYKHPTPKFVELFTINWIVDLSNPKATIDAPEGYRFSGIPVIQGNLTDTTGHQFGHIVNGVGGEMGFVDRDSVVNIEFKYAIHLDDDHYAFANILGVGGTVYWRHCYVKIETDSKKYKWLTNRFIFLNGTFASPTDPKPHVELVHWGLDTPDYPPLF